jgi:hypothetical protein
MTTLLYDGNNLAVRTYCSKEILSDTPNPNVNLWKYYFFDSIFKAMYKVEDVTEIVVAIDDKKSWRKIFWERYKEKRKTQREKSSIDWNLFHFLYSEYVHELMECVPFKFIKVDNCEADDVIAIIAKKDKRDYVVISNDEDYLQLSSLNVKIYNPQKMEYISYNKPEEFVIMKSLIGQAKDGIFNIKTPIDWPNDKRKPGFGEVAGRKVIEEGYEKWLNDNNLMERFEFNRNLIDFNRIPKVINKRILNTYKNYRMPEVGNIYGFLQRNHFKGYLEDISIVESMLNNLY